MDSHSQDQESPESVATVHSRISQKLTEVGLTPESSDSEKLLFLWKQYLHMEDDLQKAREVERKLKETQADEMKEVETYIEHIRHLSEERETIIQELETENEALKTQVVSLEQENNGEGRSESTEMLIQQGLAEIAGALHSEQIAYLLMERARLLDELDERGSSSNNDRKNSSGQPSDKELKNILEEERKEFEEELSHQRESAKMMTEQLKQEHEEEIGALMDENNKLEDDLQKAEMMVSQLKAELSKYTDADDIDSHSNQLLKTSSEDDRKQLFEERNEINREREELEKEMEEVEKDRADFKKEKDQFDQEKAVFERERSNLIREKVKLEQARSEIEEEKKEIEQKRAALQRESIAVAQKLLDLENMKVTLKEESATEKELEKESPRAQLSRSGSLSRSPSDLTLRKIIEEKTKVETELVQLKTQLRALQKEKDSHDDVVCKLKDDLERSHVQQQQLQIKNKSLKEELDELEAQLEKVETRMDSITKEKQNLSEKYETLNSEVKTLRTDAMKSYTLQDIVDILNNDKKQLSQSLESLKSKIEQTESEKTELANQNKFLSKGEQDLTNQLMVCKQELENVIMEKDILGSDKQELQVEIKKYEEREAMLKVELEETGKMKDNFAHQVETLVKENKDLLNKLDRSREDIESAKLQQQDLAKQELIIGHLKDQIQQLQNQGIISREELDKSRDRETMLISTQQALQKSHDGAEKRYIIEIDDLKMKLELTLLEFAKHKSIMEDLNKEKITLCEDLKNMDQENAKFKSDLEAERCQMNNMKIDMNNLEQKLAEKTLLADKIQQEKKQSVESLRAMEEHLKNVSQELEKEQTLRKSLESRTEDLEKIISLQVSKEELIYTQETANQERQLRGVLELKVVELEQRVKDAEAAGDSSIKQLQAEKKLTTDMECTIKDLQMTLTSQVATAEHSKLKDELLKERAALEAANEDVQKLSERLEKENCLRAELTKKIAELESAGEKGTVLALKAAADELEKERRARADCDLRLQEIEELLEIQKADRENLHHSMSGKIMSLEKRAQALQDDLFNTQDELQAFQEKYDQAVKEAEIARTETMMQQTQRDNLSVQPPGGHILSAGNHNEEDLKASLNSTNVKLQETLNELNTVKSKLYKTQEEVESCHGDINNYRREIEQVKQSLHSTTKQLELSEDQLKTMRHELVEIQGTLHFTQSQLKEKQSRLDSVIQEKDQLQRELDAVHDKLLQKITQRSNDPAFYGEKERQKHIDKVSVLEKLSQQLELDNREMSRKLSDTVVKCETLEEHLQKERLRSADKYQQRNRYTSQLEKDLDTANNQIRHLREELQKHQAKTFRLEADNLGLTAKYQSTITRLEQDIKDLKHRHGQEVTGMREKMSVSNSEVNELRRQKRELEQEQSHLRLEISRLKSDNERVEKHLEAESKQKIDLESRNSVIDSDFTKMWSQVRSLMERNTELESTNHSLNKDLISARLSLKQIEASLTQKEAAFEASTKTVIARAESSEKKGRDLQKQLEEVTDKMVNMERQLAQTDLGNVHLQGTKDTLLAVRHQLEGEKLQRSILDQTVAELKHQVALLKQSESKVRTENKELQHTILDLESHLNHLQEQSDFTVHHQTSMADSDSLLNQISRLQMEVKELQHELNNMSERRDAYAKRYEERKLRTKAKLMKARTLYTAERSRYMEHIKNMDEDLHLTQANLTKEKEWGKKMDDSYKLLLKEKRDLITQLSEVEEGLRDKARTLSMTQAKVTYLEEENSRLQSQLQAFTELKNSLSKQLKNHRITETHTDEHTETRGFGSSLGTVWESNSRADVLSQSWPLHIDPPANFRRSSVSGAYSPGDGDG